MKKSDLTYIIGCTIIIAVSLFYCCIIFFKITMPHYYPTLHEWKWGTQKGIPSMGWYGMQGFAYITAAIVAIVVYVACKRVGSDLKPGTIKGIALATIILVLAAMAFIMLHGFHKWGII